MKWRGIRSRSGSDGSDERLPLDIDRPERERAETRGRLRSSVG